MQLIARLVDGVQIVKTSVETVPYQVVIRRPETATLDVLMEAGQAQTALHPSANRTAVQVSVLHQTSVELAETSTW